jgi:CBS domain-containing protein/sporulation protein YlmC with PRC-barrel domain
MNNLVERTFLLSSLVGLPAMIDGRKVGKLSDVVVTEAGKLPEVVSFLVTRPYGHKSLLVPWAKVEKLDDHQLVVGVKTPEEIEGEPEAGQVCLRDHLLDKKVLDCDDDDVEVVYDIKLALRSGRLYATDVDCSRSAFLRRIGLKFVANLIQGLADRIRVDNLIPWTYVQRLPDDISSFKGDLKLNVLKAKLPEIHPVDLADILEELDPDERLAIFNALDTEHASDTLEEVEPRVQRELISAIEKTRASELINDMTPAQAADILAELPANDVDVILERVDAEDAVKIRHLVEHHEEAIIHFASSHAIQLPPTMTVEHVIGDYRTLARDADVVMYVYIVGEDKKLIGVVDIKELLQANPDVRLEDIMTTNLVWLRQSDPVKEASRLFKRYNFRAIPIVDDGDRMVGVIPYRDIMNLTHRF